MSAPCRRRWQATKFDGSRPRWPDPHSPCRVCYEASACVMYCARSAASGRRPPEYLRASTPSRLRPNRPSLSSRRRTVSQMCPLYSIMSRRIRWPRRCCREAQLLGAEAPPHARRFAHPRPSDMSCPAWLSGRLSGRSLSLHPGSPAGWDAATAEASRKPTEPLVPTEGSDVFRISPMGWGSVTESNRRSSPYYGVSSFRLARANVSINAF